MFLYQMMLAVPDALWCGLFPEDSNPTKDRERALLDEAAMAEARRVDALNMPEPFFIDRDGSVTGTRGKYYRNPGYAHEF